MQDLLTEIDSIIHDKKQTFILPFIKPRIKKEYTPVLLNRQLNSTNATGISCKSTPSLLPQKPSIERPKAEYNPITIGRNLKIVSQNESKAASYGKDTTNSSTKHIEEINKVLGLRGRRVRSEKRVQDYNAELGLIK